MDYLANKPYIFFSYAHANKNAIHVVTKIQKQGFNVWCDEGIKHASYYDDIIAKQIEKCSVFLAYITREYLESDYCISEIKFALEKNKTIVIVLDRYSDLKLIEAYQIGLYMRISKIQALVREKCASEEEFLDKICQTESFAACKDRGPDLIVDTQPKERKVKTKKSFTKPLIAILLLVMLALCFVFLLPLLKGGKKDSGGGESQSETPVMSETEALYALASEHFDKNEYGAAAIAFAKCGDYLDAKTRSDVCWGKLGKYLHTTILAYDPYDTLTWIDIEGTLKRKRNSEEIEDLGFCDLVSFSVSDLITIGLKSDATVDIKCYGDKIDVSEWKDIVSVCASEEYVLGLVKDGTVVAAGNNINGLLDVAAGWTDIVALKVWNSVGMIVGIKSDGSIVMTQYDSTGLDEDEIQFMDEFCDAMSKVKNAKCFSNFEGVVITEDKVLIQSMSLDLQGVVDIATDYDEHFFVLQSESVICMNFEMKTCTDFCEVCEYFANANTDNSFVAITIGYDYVVMLDTNGKIHLYYTEEGYDSLIFDEDVYAKLP